MKKWLLLCLGLLGFFVVLAAEVGPANAAVCARGVHRAGCVGRHGAVVVHTPHRCRYVFVRGVRVRRCY